MRKGNGTRFIDLLTETKCNFELQISNYTLRAKSEMMNVSYNASMQPKRVFGTFSKLKSELKDKPVPSVDRDKLIYFSHNFKRNNFYREVLNIDLKSAYAYVLLNDGFITKKLFSHIVRLPKKERLAAIGMLAAKKEVYDFTAGEPEDKGEIESPFAPFFFYAVKRTHEIMNNLRRFCGQTYLFTWVDGIYFMPSETVADDCISYLNAIGFPFEIDLLNDFEVKMLERRVYVNFEKDGEKKVFNIPFNDTQFTRAMRSVFLSPNKSKLK